MENVITVLVTIAAALVVLALHGPDKWLTAIVVTVATFGGMLSLFRRDWSIKRFWAVMGIAFLAHLLLIWWAFGVVLRARSDIGLFVCLPFVFVESFVMYHTVLFFRIKP